MSIINPAALEVTQPPSYVTTPWYKPGKKHGADLQIMSYVTKASPRTKGMYIIIKKIVTAQGDASSPKPDRKLMRSHQTGAFEFTFDDALRHMQALEKQVIDNKWQEVQAKKVMDPAVDYRNYLQEQHTTCDRGLAISTRPMVMDAAAG